MEKHDAPENLTDVPVGTPFVTPGDSMHCTRLLYLLSDAEGRTWLAVGMDENVHPGGVMSHLLPGQDVEVVSSNAQSLIVRVSVQTIDQLESAAPDVERFVSDMDLPAYPLASALVPSFSTAASEPSAAATAL